MLQALGKTAELFPLYIQCHSLEEAEEIRRIHEPILKLSTVCSGDERLAYRIHTSLGHLRVMSNSSIWFPILNGRSFRGILHSATYVPFLPNSKSHTHPKFSDFDSQTRDFQYVSWRKAESFGDALLIMVLKGEKAKLAQIKASSPSVLSVADFDHLTVSSLSTLDEGTVGSSLAGNRLCSGNYHSDEPSVLPSTSACGRKFVPLPGMSSHFLPISHR